MSKHPISATDMGRPKVQWLAVTGGQSIQMKPRAVRARRATSPEAPFSDPASRQVRREQFVDTNPVGGGNSFKGGQPQVGLLPDFDLLVMFVAHSGQFRERLLRQPVLGSEGAKAVNQTLVNRNGHSSKMIFHR